MLLLALIGVTLVFIWGHSLIPATGSAKESMRLMVMINEFLSKINAPVQLQGDKVLRKIAHATEYLVLGGEIGVFGFWRYTRRFASAVHEEGSVSSASQDGVDASSAHHGVSAVRNCRKTRIQVLFNCLHLGVWISVIDETLQLFVPGRYGQISDVWIDCAGFAVGAVLGMWICGMARKKV